MLVDFRDKVVVVSGAASGIGRATALAFAREGARLALCDVELDRLSVVAVEAERAGAACVRHEHCDVGDADAMRGFAERTQRELGVTDVLVNNAGVGLYGGFLKTSLEDFHWIMQTNFWGVVHGCHFFVPAMAERGSGHVVNVASAAGYYNSEILAAYGTSKYAVVGLSEALRDELGPQGIGVSVVCPGCVNTPIVRTMRVRGESEPARVRQSVSDWYEKRDFPPERVASAILEAVRRNRALVPVAAEAWVLYALKRLTPELTRSVVRRFSERFGPKEGG